jgi:hypothetical protein
MVNLTGFVSELLEGDSDIIIVLFNDVCEQRTELGQSLVVWVVVPTLDIDSVVWL